MMCADANSASWTRSSIQAAKVNRVRAVQTEGRYLYHYRSSLEASYLTHSLGKQDQAVRRGEELKSGEMIAPTDCARRRPTSELFPQGPLTGWYRPGRGNPCSASWPSRDLLSSPMDSVVCSLTLHLGGHGEAVSCLRISLHVYHSANLESQGSLLRAGTAGTNEHKEPNW